MTNERLRFLEDLEKRVAITEVQTQTALEALKNVKLINRTLGQDVSEETVPDSLFVKMNYHDAVSTGILTTIAGVSNLGERRPGEPYPQVSLVTGFETDVNEGAQLSGEIEIPEEYESKTRLELKKYFDALELLHQRLQVQVMQRLFDVFNYAFTSPSSYPSYLFARGNRDGLNEPLVSTQHARKDGGAVVPNTFTGASNMKPITDDNLWAAKVNVLAGMVSDIGDPVARGWGELVVVAHTQNPALRTVFELGKSEFKIDTANNNINIHYLQGWRVLHSPLLDKIPLSSWFVVDSTSFRMSDDGIGLIVVEFMPITSKIIPPEQTKTDVYTYSVKYSFKCGWNKFYNVFGSKGDSSTYTL